MRLFKKKQERNIIDQYDSEAPGIIEIQRLFKTLINKDTSENIKSVMVTSAVPQEGKSLLVGNLALVAANANKRTLIIDADMRRPVQHRQLHLPSYPGLSDFLRQEADFDQIFHSTELDNLKLIPYGKRVSSPGGLLQVSIRELKVLIDKCQMHFDVILVDVPPVIPVNDSEMIASLVDGVVLVIMSGKTYREIVSRAIDLLNQADCNLLGMVLNNVGSVLPYYYERSYYQYPAKPI